jgi:hypothetical protein
MNVMSAVKIYPIFPVFSCGERAWTSMPLFYQKGNGFRNAEAAETVE